MITLIKKRSNEKLKLDDNYLKDFYFNFLSEYKKYVETEFNDREKDFPLYFDKGVSVHILKEDNGISIKYQEKLKGMDIHFYTDSKKFKTLKDDGSESMLNWYANNFLTDPKERAKRDVGSYILHEEYLEMQKERDQELYQEYLNRFDPFINQFLHGIDYCNEVREKTIEDNKEDLFYAIEKSFWPMGVLQLLFIKGYNSFFDNNIEIQNDLETSIFLCINGLYSQANATLRRVFEISLINFHFLRELNQAKSEKRKKSITEKRKKWLNRTASFFMGGNNGTISKLMINPYEQKATLIYNSISKDTQILSFDKYLREYYSQLSDHVHRNYYQDENTPIVSISDYDPTQFNEWQTNFQKLHKIIYILIFTIFNDVMTQYDEDKIVEELFIS